MSEKNCELCGMLIQPAMKFCETCAQMMGVETINQIPQSGESYLTQANGILQPQTYPTVQNHFEPALISDQNLNQVPQAANIGFQSNYQSYSPKPVPKQGYRTAPVNRAAEEIYKPGLLDWFWDLPTFFKIGIFVLIGSIIFALALRAFMNMDVSVVNTTTAPAAKLDTQTPWFSSWVRSSPTVEEVFSKYEEEISAKGKPVWSQSYKLTGDVHFLKISGSDLPNLNELYKNQGVVSAKAPEATQSRGVTRFELYLKYPNSVLLKGATDYRLYPNQLNMDPLITGFDGIKYWGVAKVNSDKGLMTEDIKSPTPVFYTNILNGGISLTFSKQSFQKAELVDEEVVFDRKSYTIKGTDLLGTETSVSFDIETGLLTKIAQKGLIMHVVAHQEFNGVKYPSKLVYKINNQWMLLSIGTVETDALIDNAVFMRSTHF